MEEFDNKEVGQIRFEFTDGTWFILDQNSLRHLKSETKNEVDSAISKACGEILEKRKEAEKQEGASDLGVQVTEELNTKDKLV